MTELTEQEREEAFITLALSQKNAELYRRYGAMSPDELDKTGIPDLRRKMWEMTSRLIFAGPTFQIIGKLEKFSDGNCGLSASFGNIAA